MKHKYKKTIKLFLLDGDPNKRIVCEISNWTGKAYRIPRGSIKDCANREELSGPAVYLLFGRQETDSDKPKVYIGEAENALGRLKQHIGEKEFWNDAVVFFSKDENLNKAHIKYLESTLYQLATEADRFQLENQNNPPKPSLSESDQAEMEEFADYIKILTSILGYKLFDPLLVSDSANEKTEVPDIDMLYIRTPDGQANARGKRTVDGFVVTKGSQIKPSITNSYSLGYRSLREKLIKEEVVLKDGEHLVLNTDYLFSSPSAAASIVLGRSANGLVEWKNQVGVKLKDLEIADLDSLH